MSEEPETRVLLVALGAFGDCLMATTIARQIKSDFPGCHLTWAISKRFSSVVDHNPYVDHVWRVESSAGESLTDEVWRRVRKEAQRLKEAGELDYVYDVQIYPNNRHFFDGTTRTSTFRCYPGDITVPVSPVFVIADQERKAVDAFAATNELSHFRHVVLFECAPSSGQSTLTLQKGLDVALEIVHARSDVVVIVSTHLPFASPHERILDGSCLTFRQNAPLSHYCTMLVGCSSGISWLLTSDACKRLPTVQFLNRRAIASGFASIVYDFSYWGIPCQDVIESGLEHASEMAQVVIHALEDFRAARGRYHEVFRPAFWDCLCFVDYRSVHGVLKFGHTLSYYVSRNNFSLRDYFNVRPLFRVIGYAMTKFCAMCGRLARSMVKVGRVQR